MSRNGTSPRRLPALGTAVLVAAAFALVVVPATGAPVVSYVQGTALDTGARVPSAQVHLPGAVGAGDLLVGWFSEFNAAGALGVSDTVNGAWTRAPASETFGGAGGDIALYYVQNTLASPAGITIDVSAPAPAYLQAAVGEYSGVATSGALDQVALAAGAGTAVDSGATAPVAAGDLVFSALVTGGTPGGEAPGASQGVTATTRAVTNSGASYAQDITAAAPGPQNGRATLAVATDWYAVAAAFHPVPSVTPTPPSAPVNLTASSITPTSVLLNWKASVDNVALTGYTVVRNGVPIATTTSTTYQDVAVVPLTAYTYTVTSSNIAGQTSAASNAVTVATPAASGSSSYVQGASFATGTRTPSTDVPLTGAVGAGDLLVGWFSQYNAAGPVGVSDTVNGTWTRAAGSTTFGAAGGDIALYYVQNSAASAAGVTVTVSAPAPAYLEGAVGEYAGVATSGALDQVAAATGLGTAADSGPTAPVAAGDLVFSAIVTGGSPGTVTPGTSQGVTYTARSTIGSGAAYAQDIAASAAGPQNGRATLAAATDWYAVAAAFHPVHVPPHVMVIVMENHSASDIIGNPAAPFINSLATQYASLTNWSAVSHPSLPNYLALTNGETQAPGPPDCVPLWSAQAAPSCTYEYARDNLAHQLTSAGVDWKAYLEGLPAPCDLTDAFGPNGYDVNHNPFAYYDTVRNYPAECNRVVPYAQLATDLAGPAAPSFLYVAPNVVHDMHDGTIADGDTWLQSTLQTVFASSWYAQHGTVIITWDEGLSSQTVAMLVVSAGLKGRGDLNQFGNHFGMLRSLEEVYGVPLLNNAANAANGDIAPLLGG